MRTSTIVVPALLAAAVAGGGGAGARDVGTRGPGALLVRSSPAVAPCVAAAAAAMEASSGRRLQLETAKIGPAGSARGADVVVAFEQELTRVLEGGESAEDLDVDVATIPWVFVGSGAAGEDPRALARSGARVNVFGGVISRHARQSLESLPPARVRSVADPSIATRLAPGELALVPLSLAGPGPVSPADVPVLRVRAVGVRASERQADARVFLEFLTGTAGQQAFGRCGRKGSR